MSRGCFADATRKTGLVEFKLKPAALSRLHCTQGRSRSRDWGHIGPYGERGVRAYNGGLGAVPPAGSRGRAPGQRVRGASPPEAEHFCVVICHKCRKAAMFINYFMVSATIFVTRQLSYIFLSMFGRRGPLPPPLPSAPDCTDSPPLRRTLNTPLNYEHDATGSCPAAAALAERRSVHCIVSIHSCRVRTRLENGECNFTRNSRSNLLLHVTYFLVIAVRQVIARLCFATTCKGATLLRRSGYSLGFATHF